MASEDETPHVDDESQEQQPQNKERSRNEQMTADSYIKGVKSLIQGQRKEWQKEGREDWETAKVSVASKCFMNFKNKDGTGITKYDVGRWLCNQKYRVKSQGKNGEAYRNAIILQAAGLSNFDKLLEDMDKNPQLYEEIKKSGRVKIGKANMKETASTNLATESNARSTQDPSSNNAGRSNEKESRDRFVTKLCESLMDMAHGEKSPPYDGLSDEKKVDIGSVIELQKEGKLTNTHMLYLESVNFPWFISVEEAFQYAINVYTKNNNTFKEPASKNSSQGLAFTKRSLN